MNWLPIAKKSTKKLVADVIPTELGHFKQIIYKYSDHQGYFLLFIFFQALYNYSTIFQLYMQPEHGSYLICRASPNFAAKFAEL